MSAMARLLAAFDTDDEEPTIGFHWVKRRFGARCSDARFVEFLTNLIAECGFPKPLPHPRHGGGIERGVTDKSCWIRAAVFEWMADFLPPAIAQALDARAQEDAADEMDEAAARLQLVVSR